MKVLGKHKAPKISKNQEIRTNNIDKHISPGLNLWVLSLRPENPPASRSTQDQRRIVSTGDTECFKRGSSRPLQELQILHFAPKTPKPSASEALPEDDLWSVLLIFLLTDPCGAEGRRVGQHRSSAPHQEVSGFGASDPNVHRHV